jgi:hypothetical protein
MHIDIDNVCEYMWSALDSVLLHILIANDMLCRNMASMFESVHKDMLRNISCFSETRSQSLLEEKYVN